MSWATKLLDASYRGIGFDVVDENFQAARAISQHGTPYRDGDTSEDLGRTARQFALKAVIFGDSYEMPLQALIQALDTPGPGELVHPVYGSVTVLAQSWTVQHSAQRPNYAEINLRFIEQLPDEPFFDKKSVDIFDLIGIIDSLLRSIQNLISGGWMGLLENLLGLPGIGLRIQQLRAQFMGVLSGLASMFNLAGSGKIKSVFDPIADPKRFEVEIRTAIRDGLPVSESGQSFDVRALQSRAFVPAAMPGADSLPAEVARLGTAIFSEVRAGSNTSFVIEPSSGSGSGSGSGAGAGAGAGQKPSEAVLLIPEQMPSDPVLASGYALVTLVVSEFAIAVSEAVAVVIETEAEKPTMSPAALEELVNLSRSLTQAAIFLHRQLYSVEQAYPVIEAMRQVASTIQARAREVILQQPPLVLRTIEAPTSLRLLAHRWYGDHDRALELLRLNPTLRNPHNIQPGQVLYAYAK